MDTVQPDGRVFAQTSSVAVLPSGSEESKPKENRERQGGSDVAHPARSKLSKPKRTAVCRHFDPVSRSGCRSGDKCRYSHQAFQPANGKLTSSLASDSLGTGTSNISMAPLQVMLAASQPPRGTAPKGEVLLKNKPKEKYVKSKQKEQHHLADSSSSSSRHPEEGANNASVRGPSPASRNQRPHRPQQQYISFTNTEGLSAAAAPESQRHDGEKSDKRMNSREATRNVERLDASAGGLQRRPRQSRESQRKGSRRDPAKVTAERSSGTNSDPQAASKETFTEKYGAMSDGQQRKRNDRKRPLAYKRKEGKDKADLEGQQAEGAVTCLICCSTIDNVRTFNTIGACNHRGCCSLCVLRMRQLMKELNCAICKTRMDKVICIEDESQSYESFESWGDSIGPNHVFDEDSQMFLIKKGLPYVQELRGIKCKGGDKCGESFLSLKAYKAHLGKGHGLSFCELCLKSKMLFVSEQALFTKKALERHEKKGDPEEGFQGHPLCRFCGSRWYSNNELYDHLHRDHYECHLCQSLHNVRDRYYRDYNELEQHFRSSHLLCEEPDCLRSKFVVFGNIIDYKAHMASVHPHLRIDRNLEVGFRVRRGDATGLASEEGSSTPFPRPPEPLALDMSHLPHRIETNQEAHFPSLPPSLPNPSLAPSNRPPGTITAASQREYTIKLKSLRCPCGRRTAFDDDIDVSSVEAGLELIRRGLPCNEECKQLERNRRLASALGVEENKPGQAVKYSDALIAFGLANPATVARIEKRLDQFLKLDFTPRNLTFNFSAMDRPTRAFVHELCTYYGLSTASYGFEPKRYICVHRTKASTIPPQLLSTVLRSTSLSESISRDNGRLVSDDSTFKQAQSSDVGPNSKTFKIYNGCWSPTLDRTVAMELLSKYVSPAECKVEVLDAHNIRVILSTVEKARRVFSGISMRLGSSQPSYRDATSDTSLDLKLVWELPKKVTPAPEDTIKAEAAQVPKSRGWESKSLTKLTPLVSKSKYSALSDVSDEADRDSWDEDDEVIQQKIPQEPTASFEHHGMEALTAAPAPVIDGEVDRDWDELY